MQNGGRRSSEGVLSPVIANDLLTITPVILRSSKKGPTAEDVSMIDSDTGKQKNDQENNQDGNSEPAAKKAKLEDKGAIPNLASPPRNPIL